ncbi:MAG: DEAD/DEAH box helicase, partial [Candidatus Diapherotrites archaeon]|nr:DEAD/DEAH box helicase [Candidatus Diapherotrites archaeon]
MLKSKDDVKDLVLKARGFPNFNPVQSLTLEKGLLDFKSLVVSAPTASGKTVVAELASLNTVLNQRGKVLYVCPLKALASEHSSSFKQAYSDLGVKVDLSIGDLDTTDSWLRNSDIIFSTNEKADSWTRHKAQWLRDVKLLVVDEIHMLDNNRGPTLEILITKMRQMVPGLQVLGLSATVPNFEEIAEWLDAVPVYSEWRPIKLQKGLIMDKTLSFDDGETKKISSLKVEDDLRAIVEDTFRLKKQLLIFRNSRRNAMASAKKFSLLTERRLSSEEKEKLKSVSERVLKALEKPTAQCKVLAECISKGAAFHTAGLVEKQRK